MTFHRLPLDFYARPALEVAPDLLGKLLVHVTPEGTASGYITETEAYVGPEDKAAHSYGGRKTDRTRAMFGPPGRAYVYLIYGLHHCFNVVVAAEDQPEAVLVRSLKPKDGLELMFARRRLKQQRPGNNICRLTDGPGKLCQALGITKQQYGCDLTGEQLFITSGISVPAENISAQPRINIDYAKEWAHLPWRFVWQPD